MSTHLEVSSTLKWEIPGEAQGHLKANCHYNTALIVEAHCTISQKDTRDN